MRKSTSILRRSAIALVIMSLLCGGILLSITAGQVSRDSYETASKEYEKAIVNAANLLDSMFYEFYRYSIVISYASELRPVNINTMVEQINAKEKLNELKNVNNNVLNICVYYFEKEMFISNDCSYTPEYFKNSFYRLDNISSLELYNLFTESNFSKANPIFKYCGDVYSPDNGGYVKNCILIVMPLPYWNGNLHATMGLLVDTSHVVKQLSLAAGSGMVRITNTNGEVLLTANNQVDDNAEYHCFSQKSDYFDLIYEIYVDETQLSQYSVFSNKLVAILLMSGLLFCICVFLMAKWVSRPVRQLVMHIAKDDRTVGNDFNLLQSYIYDLNAKVEQSHIFANELIIRRLLSGQEIIGSDLNMCETEFKGDYSACFVFLIQFESTFDDIKQLTRIEEAHTLIHLFRWNAINTLIGTIATDSNVKDALNHFSFFDTHKPRVVACGIGENDISMLSESLLSAENLFNNLLYRNRKGVFFADNEDQLKSIYPSDEIHDLRHAMDTHSASQLRNAAEKIESALQSPSMSLECASMVAYELAIIFPEIRESINNVDEFCEILKYLIDDKIQAFSQETQTELATQKSGDGDEFVQRVKEFIAEQLLNQEFGITYTAHAFGMTDSAFSHAFKRAFNETYIDYVNRLKMNTAKEMLSEGKMSIEEVAHRLGYSSASNFSRMFKALTGSTPGAYRRIENK